IADLPPSPGPSVPSTQILQIPTSSIGMRAAARGRILRAAAVAGRRGRPDQRAAGGNRTMRRQMTAGAGTKERVLTNRCWRARAWPTERPAPAPGGARRGPRPPGSAASPKGSPGGAGGGEGAAQKGEERGGGGGRGGSRSELSRQRPTSHAGRKREPGTHKAP